MKRKVFFLPEEHIDLLALYAGYRDRSQAEIVRSALDQFFARAALHDPYVQELIARVRNTGKDGDPEVS